MTDEVSLSPGRLLEGPGCRCLDAAPAQQLASLGGSNRPAEMKPLRLSRGIRRSEQRALLFRLHAHGDDPDSDVVREADDGTDGRRTGSIRARPVDKGLSDFQMIDAIGSNIVER